MTGFHSPASSNSRESEFGMIHSFYLQKKTPIGVRGKKLKER